MKKLLFLLMLLAFYGCEKYAIIHFENSSADTLYIAVSQDDYIEHSDEVTMNEVNPKLACTREILPGVTEYIKKFGKNGWIRFIERSEGDKLRVFTINHNDFHNNSWKEIIKKKLYKKAKYSLRELEYNKWNITLE